MDGNSLIFCGTEFLTVGAANRKALRVLAVKGTGRRLSKEERIGMGRLLKLISDKSIIIFVYEQVVSMQLELKVTKSSRTVHIFHSSHTA